MGRFFAFIFGCVPRAVVSIVLAFAFTVSRPGNAAVTEASICESASEYASDRVGVPLDVMRALTRTETGRNLEGQFLPWPWTVNMEGEGKWFATMQDALAYAVAHFDVGARSFDVGCFQVNYKWHGEAFASIEDMFDPYQNALYAAQFMASLYQELGSWTKAAGAYHSRTPEFAERYSSRFDGILTNLGSDLPQQDWAPDTRQSDDLVWRERVAVPTFAPLVPEKNQTGSLFQLDDASQIGLLTQSRGGLLSFQ